ncbi:MAG: HNH endonuclease [Oscillospiraceae bacterium]|nr:HNH endonuclease [Oscillospiraceae bacterium]
MKDQGFYNRSTWKRLRRQVLIRDHFVCQLRTSRQCTGIATEVHHIQDLEEHPELALDMDNLTSCCWWCHEETKVQFRRGMKSDVRVIRISDGSENEAEEALIN